MKEESFPLFTADHRRYFVGDLPWWYSCMNGRDQICIQVGVWRAVMSTVKPLIVWIRDRRLCNCRINSSCMEECSFMAQNLGQDLELCSPVTCLHSCETYFGKRDRPTFQQQAPLNCTTFGWLQLCNIATSCWNCNLPFSVIVCWLQTLTATISPFHTPL